MKFLITEEPEGGTAYLTNESCQSRYGIPVLEITAEDVDGTFGPADVIGDLERPDTLMTGAQIVAGWASAKGRTEEELEATRAFLGQWPEGPQVRPLQKKGDLYGSSNI